MGKLIEVKPVTRIEGHAKVTIQLDDEGEVADAHFHVLELRGFEKFLEGRPVEEAPLITPRICGICYVAHHLASAKAMDAVFGVEIPETAYMLRELFQMGGFIHSHSLHFFFLGAPDFVLGPDADPKIRNIVGIVQKAPDVAKKAIKIRAYGQKITEVLGGKPIHPSGMVPGGVSKPLSKTDRDKLLSEVDEIISLCEWGVELGRELLLDKYLDTVKTFAVIQTHHIGLVKKGALELYDGPVRVMLADGEIHAEFQPHEYLDYIAERVEPYSSLKFPYLKKLGWPEGIYRVNSLSRINVADKISTPKANEVFKEFRNEWCRPAQHTLLFHYARLIETLYAAERAKELLEDEKILGENVHVPVKPREGDGVGIVEAPRGVLIHHYITDKNGFITEANLIVATVQNNPAMDLCVREVAKAFIHKGEVKEGLLNRVEMAIRAYDPCLSCATHVGGIPLEVEVLDAKGKPVRTIRSQI